ncbi:MAG: hypothetical protein HUJ70_06800 [Pseudobutyrivibrio sp.]|nr:hypothetical protein [Pseudobutyrivibrio sp.]
MKNKTTFKLTTTFIVYIIFVLLFFAAFRNESSNIFFWYLTLLLLGLIGYPVSSCLFSAFSDKGYVFSKTIAIATCGMAVFWLSSYRILPFTSENCIIVSIIVGLVIALISRSGIIKYQPLDSVCLACFMQYEIAFILIFSILLYVKGFNPSAYGTERFMDYGFMTSMMNTTYFPAEDFWFSGTNLNYYYIGQYLAVFLTKLCFGEVEYTYNLMLMTIAALGMLQAFSIVSNLYRERLITEGYNIKLSAIAGTLGSLCVFVMGNFHYVIFRFILPFLNKHFGADFDEELIGTNYWFPQSTRYIGYNPETDDKTIHEFPSYSIILGDLHAHVINIVFVLTVIGLLTAYCLKYKNERKDISFDFSFLKELFIPPVIVLGFFLGLFRCTNYWDYPIYMVVSVSVILFLNLRVFGFKALTLLLTLAQTCILFVEAVIVPLPFMKSFDKMASKICLAFNHSPIYKLLILWGFFFVVLVTGLVLILVDYRVIRNNTTGKQTNPVRSFDYFMHQICISDFIVFILSMCGMGLILTPEFIYVKDIYENGFARSNTMFKLTYQGYILMALCLAYFVAKLVGSKHLNRRIWGIILTLFILIQCLYSVTAVKLYMGNVFEKEGYKGVSALYYLNHDDDFKNDIGAIEYINKNIKNKSTILEANGLSYTKYNRISVITGMPTVVGWHTHEWLWKDDVDAVNKRGDDVTAIYTSTDAAVTKKLIDSYNIDYIYVGDCEYEKYNSPETCVEIYILMSMGEVVYKSPGTDDLKATYIIKVNK